MNLNNPLIEALRPLTSRVRVDVTAIRMEDGSSRWSGGPLDDQAVAQHLNGGPGRGVCPIKAGESVTMVGLLDFDSHKGVTSWQEMSRVVGTVVDALRAEGMEPVLFRSSGGRGVHLYLLWDEPQDAYSVRVFLAEVLKSVGLKSGSKGGVAGGEVEVFPKQNEVAVDKFGNQAILPLHAKSVPLALEDLEELW